MTVSSTISSIIYSCDGSTTVFDVPFRFLENSDLKLSIQATDGTVTNLVLNSDYTVTGANADNGGKVYLVHPVDNQAKLSILRVVDLLQETDYRENERFPAESHERALDKLTMEVQQLQEQSDRSIKLDVFSDVGPDVLIGQVERMWDSVDNIDIVANDKDNMNTVALNIADVNTNATNMPDINTNATNISSIKTNANNITDITTTASHISEVDIVSNNIADISNVSNSIGNVNTVANNSANVTAVATNISDVNAVVTNMAAIQAAPTAATNAANSAQSAQDAADKVQGLIATPIGTIFQSVYVDESLDIARQLNGQLIYSTKFTGFRNWLNTVQTANPNLFTTETNWQAEKTNSKLGQCGKFVIDDDAGTIRLPCVVNAQGLTDLALIGAIKNESLPDAIYYSDDGWGTSSGDATRSLVASKGGYEVNNTGKGLLVGNRQDTTSTYSYSYGKLSASNSTYQDNAPVQQEAVQYPYYIQVATGVEETLPAIKEYKVNNSDFFGKSMYSDVAPNNASWLVSNGQWNAKSVYPDYYDWLLEQINAGVSGFVSSTASYTDYDFVINTTDQTFRLPLKNGQEGIFADGVKGNGMTLGLLGSDNKNGGLQCGANGTVTATYNAFGTEVGSAASNDSMGVSRIGITTDPSKSGMVVDKTVPAGWNLYYYVGDTIQDASVINAGAVLGQLANGINRTAKSDRETVVGWGFPDWDTEVQLSGKEYTATYKCWLVSLTNISGTAEALLYINGKLVTKEYGDYAQLQIPLDVGDVVTSNTQFVSTSIYAMKGLVND